ncbi:MAG: FHA domain-containing protein [Betaproteobacteria bacterium]|nr:FHA domain-containing protein [Betaproteobacteria bacterium]
MLRQWLARRSASRLVALQAVLGSTHDLFVGLGEARARQFLEHTVNRLAHRAAAASGLVARSDSSSLLVLFEQAEQALRTACQLREELRAWCLDVDPGFELPMDMGLSSGAVLCRPPAFEGETLLRASTLAAAAHGGEILMDQGVLAALPPDLAARARRSAPAPGFGHIGTAWTFACDDAALPRVAAPLWLNLRSPDGLIHLSFTPDRPIRIGRDARSDVVVEHPAISRQHAVIVWRNGSYMLADMSRNGTWVRHQAAPKPLFLKRGVCLLGSTGSLNLGRRPLPWRAPELLFSVTAPAQLAAGGRPDALG